jgi:hypothetical protein
MIPDIAEEAAGVSVVVRCDYLIRYLICYLISYRIRYSPSAATLTDMTTLTDMVEQRALGRKRRRRTRTRTMRTMRKEKEVEEKVKVKE